jgi:hypothetical protein
MGVQIMAESAGPEKPSRHPPIILLAWLVGAVALVWYAWPGLAVDGPLDADSTMRLVQVRDLLGGQGWFDTVQHRLGPPEGTSLHWSRLVDAPLAGLVLLFDRVSPSRWIAEMLAVTAWPLLLLLALMAASASVASALSGRAAAILAALLAMQSGPALVHYLPGAIDHHNVQIVLSLAFAACILRADRTWTAGIGAGLAAGLMLAVGTETLPVIVTGTVILVLAWLFEPGRFAPAARTYGLVFAAATLASLASTVMPAHWPDASCDALSATYAALAAAGGFGLAVFTLLLGAGSSLFHRVVALAGLGAICIAMVLIAFPECLSGPLGAIDPRVRDIWYDRLPEVASLRVLVDTEFATAVSIVAVPLIGFLAAMGFMTAADDERRYRWAAAALFAGTTLLSMVLQNRAAAGAGAVAVPIVACLVVSIARRGGGEGARISVPLLLVVLPFVSFVVWHTVGTAALQPLAPRLGLTMSEPHVAVARDCLERTAYGELAAIDPTVVLTHTTLASSILAHTGHEVVAGNYHRGAAAILDTYEAFSSSGNTPPGVIARRGVGLVVVCHDGADGKVGDPALVAGLLGRLKRGEVPAWLDPVFVGDRLLAYRVKAP